jgi:hypothetical protein
MRSSVFEAMFFGPAAESSMPIMVSDVDSDTLKAMLQ